MAQSVLGETKKECSYASSPFGRLCPFDAAPDHDRCIFHLPADKKEPERFWLHMASYLCACYDAAGTDQTALKDGRSHWFIRERDDGLFVEYEDRTRRRMRADEPWYFNGFIFPAMDRDEGGHNFQHFVFPAVDLTYATFHANANFADATFLGKARFISATFADKQTAANFSSAKFLAGVDFFAASFNAQADFSGAELGKGAAVADFREATFNGKAIFTGTAFRANALFSDTMLDELQSHNEGLPGSTPPTR